MIDIHSAQFFTDLRQRDMELRAQRHEQLIEARVATVHTPALRSAVQDRRLAASSRSA